MFIKTILTLFRRRAGVLTHSFEDGTDSARRDALSQQSCELLVVGADKVAALGNAAGRQSGGAGRGVAFRV